MDAHHLIAAFAQSAGVAGLRLDDRGLARLQIDGAVAVDLELEPDTGLLHLHAVLGRLPPAPHRAALCERLLEANLFGRQTGGAALAVDAAAGECLLWRALEPEALDLAAFTTRLEAFVDAADHWTGELAADPATPKPAAAAPAVPRPQDMLRA